jgi:hypothetical protein
MSFSLLWYISQRWMVVSYRRFGTAHPSHIKGSRSPKKCSILEDWTYMQSKRR